MVHFDSFNDRLDGADYSTIQGYHDIVDGQAIMLELIFQVQ